MPDWNYPIVSEWRIYPVLQMAVRQNVQLLIKSSECWPGARRVICYFLHLLLSVTPLEILEWNPGVQLNPESILLQENLSYMNIAWNELCSGGENPALEWISCQQKKNLIHFNGAKCTPSQFPRCKTIYLRMRRCKLPVILFFSQENKSTYFIEASLIFLLCQPNILYEFLATKVAFFSLRKRKIGAKILKYCNGDTWVYHFGHRYSYPSSFLGENRFQLQLHSRIFQQQFWDEVNRSHFVGFNDAVLKVR